MTKSEFIEVRNIDDLVTIYNLKTRSEFELRLNEYIHTSNARKAKVGDTDYLKFWDTLKQVVDKAGVDYYNYYDLIKERGNG